MLGRTLLQQYEDRAMLSLIKRFVSTATQGRLFSRLMTQCEKADSRQPNVLRVLMYHRVDEPIARPDLDPMLLSATPAAFAEQMRFLAEQYHVVSMRQVVDACQGGTPLPPRAVLITFDDAYRDFAENAWPILKRFGLPATVFVATGYPDQPERTFWWDRLYQAFASTSRREDLDIPSARFALRTTAQRDRAGRRVKKYVKTLPHEEAMALVARLSADLDAPTPRNHVLGWEELRWLAREGVTLGPHTQTHPLLTRVEEAQADAEIGGSLETLKREIGDVLPAFAYPAGACNDMAVRVLRRRGIVVALTTAGGINDLAVADHLRLRRINVGVRTNLGLLRAQLLPWTLARRGRGLSTALRL